MQQNTDNFPDFLFPEDKLESVKRLKLTAQEQELFGLMLIYGKTYWDTYDFDGYGYGMGRCGLPYEYVKEVGAFNIMNIEGSLISKIGWKDIKTVISIIRDNPNEVLDISKASPSRLLELCKTFKKRGEESFGNRCYEFNYTWYDKIIANVKLLNMIDESGDKLVLHYWDSNGHYTYKRSREFNFFDGAWLDSSCKDLYCKITRYKDNIESFHFDTNSKEYEYEKYHSQTPLITVAEMTEQGKQLLDWYRKNFPNSNLLK